jgi:hypothetical protein
MSWVGRLAFVGEKRNAHRILVRKPEGKRPFRRPTLKLKYDIKGDVKDLGEDRDTIVVCAVMNCQGL